LRALDEKGSAVWLRVPIVPGWNDRPGDIEAVGRLAAGLRSIRRIHLLPYHRLASEKYRGMGRTYPLDGVKPPPLERLETMAMRLAAFGLDVHVGG
jgi:pyruvate formate lyase activating enzyme